MPGPARFWPGGAEREAKVVISPRQPKGPRREAVHVDPAVLAAGDHHGSTFVQHQRFREAALGRGAVEVTLEDGLRAVAIGEAGERSIRDGVPIRL